jgi:hypothetical protein
MQSSVTDAAMQLTVACKYYCHCFDLYWRAHALAVRGNSTWREALPELSVRDQNFLQHTYC